MTSAERLKQFDAAMRALRNQVAIDSRDDGFLMIVQKDDHTHEVVCSVHFVWGDSARVHYRNILNHGGQEGEPIVDQDRSVQ